MPELSPDEFFAEAKPAGPSILSADDFLSAAPAPKPASSSIGSVLTKGVKNVGSIADMVLGLPGQALGVGADIGGRVSALLHGGSSSDAAWAGKALRESVPEALTAPISKALKVAGIDSGLDDSDVSQLMGKAMGLVARGGQWVEEKTGKVLKQQDVESLVNTTLMGLGGRGLGAVVDPRLKAMGRVKEDPAALQAKLEAKVALDEELAGKKAAEAPIETSTGRVIPRVDQPTPMRASTPEEMKALEKQERKVLRQKEKDVRAAFAEDPVYADQLEGRADLADQARELEGRHSRTDVLQATGERTRPATRTSVDEAPRNLSTNEFFDLTAETPTALDSGTAKIARGRRFDLTAEELAAVNASKSSFNRPELFGEDGKVLNVGKRRGQQGAVDMESLLSMNPASALKTILDKSPYTLRSLTYLPGNHSEFTTQMIREQLRRADITQAEKDLMGPILDAAGEKITARDLVVGVRQAMGDWELARKSTDKWADYGLENINRESKQGVGPEPWMPEEAGTVEQARVLEEHQARLDKALDATTNVYELPAHMEMSTANHFKNPRYFGHTRSFEEGGVRHVVEVQSDLAQKTKGAVKPEEATGLLKEMERIQDEKAAVLKDYDPHTDSAKMRQLNLQQAEIQAKLDATSIDSQLKPVLKHWPRRLVREELGNAAAEGKDVVRFATADTMAKVEGWPEAEHPQERSIRNLRHQIEGMEKETGYYENPTEMLREIRKEQLPALREELKRLEAQKAQEPTSKFAPEHQGIYDRHAKDIDKFLKQHLGGKEVTDASGHTWIEAPTIKGPKQMLGGADPELLQKLAVIGGGAALAAFLSGTDEDGESNAPKNAALTAAALGIASFAKSRSPAVRDLAESAGRGAEYALGLVSTRVGNMSKPLLRRMREHERGVLTRTHDNLQVVGPFLERLAKIPAAAKAELNAAILTNDNAAVLKAMGKAGDPALVKEWKAVRAKLEDLGKGLVSSGRLKELLPDYYPRVVEDVPGLLQALGKEQRSFLEKKLEDARLSAMRKDGRDLSPLETSQIVNKVLKGQASGGRPGYLKERSIGEISPELAKFYAPAEESLPLYIRAVSRELERAKFFGEDLVRDSEGGLANIDLSIGNVVNRERLAGKLTEPQVEDLRSILQSRFGPGERGSAGPIQLMKNLTNAGLLGNVASAVVQTGDVMLSVAQQGFLPTIKALQQIVTRDPAKVTMKDLGLINHVTEEVSGGSRNAMKVGGMEVSSAKFLDKVFRYSGFTLIDQLGKSASINAAANRFRAMAKTEKGRKNIEAKYGEAYGADFPQLVKDLQSGTLTENVKGLLFSELSDIQPISRLEVPQAYLDMPNGRAVYMLKTYMLKQADIIRREAIGEMRRGNVGKGTTNLLRYATALGIGGATTDLIKNWLLGRDENELDWASVTENMMKTFGWSQYVIDQARKGKPIQAFGGTVLPPYKMWDELLSRDPKAINYLPLFGRLIYGREMGGSEKADAREIKRKEKEESK